MKRLLLVLFGQFSEWPFTSFYDDTIWFDKDLLFPKMQRRVLKSRLRKQGTWKGIYEILDQLFLALGNKQCKKSRSFINAERIFFTELFVEKCKNYYPYGQANQLLIGPTMNLVKVLNSIEFDAILSPLTEEQKKELLDSVLGKIPEKDRWYVYGRAKTNGDGASAPSFFTFVQVQ